MRIVTALTVSVAPLLLWWFAIAGGEGNGRVVGPFDTEAKCKQVRVTWSAYWGTTTPCWKTTGQL